MSRKNRTNGVAYFQLLCILIRMTSITAGVLGASGYAGAELLRLLARHPSLRVTWAAGDSSASEPVASRYPGLGHAYGDLAFCTVDEGLSKGAEVLFAALPHGRAAAIAERLGAAAGLVVDLSADFRLHDPAAYPTWYGTPHPPPEELGTWPYGLPELHRDELRGARRVAVPGCYPTAALLALAPLLAAGLVEPDGIVVDAKSGLSGAGRSLTDTYLYVQANENVTPYGVGRHRHTPEIEQELGRAAGRLLTVTWPATRAVVASNRAQVAAAVLGGRRVVAASAIDNLVKGAAGQALQCANLALGLPETAGLELVPPGP